MKAYVEYDAEDVKRLICRDILSRFGVQVNPQHVHLTRSEDGTQIAFATDLNTAKPKGGMKHD